MKHSAYRNNLLYPARTRIFLLTILVLLIIGYTGIALYDVNQQGILYYDAATYLLDAKFLDKAVSLMLTHGVSDFRRPEFWEAHSKEISSGSTWQVAKPGFRFILWIAGKIFGFHDNLSLYVGIIFSTMGLLITYLIARSLGTVEAGIYAVAILTSSIFYLIYARSGYPEQVTNVFALIGIFFYIQSLKSKNKFLNYGTGWFMGYAYSGPGKLDQKPGLN